MFYLMWFDNDKRKAVATKIQEAITAYERKLGIEPTVVLISREDEELLRKGNTPADPRVQYCEGSGVRKDNYWVGVA